MLSRVRIGQQTVEDIQKLHGRELKIYRNDPKYPSDILHLFTSFESAQEYNQYMLSKQDSAEFEMARILFPKLHRIFPATWGKKLLSIVEKPVVWKQG